MNMKIVINDEVVGELTEYGEIITDDIYLKELADKIGGQNPVNLRSRRTKQCHYFYIAETKKGDPDYRGTVADILLDNGYGFK